MRVLKHTLEIINLTTDQNPVQVYFSPPPLPNLKT